MKKTTVFLIILVLIFAIGCAKILQKELQTKKDTTNQTETPKEPTIAKNDTTKPEEQKPPEFVSNMNCTGATGMFTFTLTNIGNENLSISKVFMHIKAKLFFPKCDVETLEPNKSTRCSQNYYTKIIGGAPVKIEAKIGKNIERYVQTVPC